MYLTVHSLVALTSIKYIHAPLLLFIVNFLLHYILDIIPHGDGNEISRGFKNKNKNLFLMASLDFLFVIIISFIIYKNFQFNIYHIIFAISGAILLDILWGFYKITNFRFLKWADDISIACHKLIGYKPKYIFEYSFQFIPIIICYFLLTPPPF